MISISWKLRPLKGQTQKAYKTEEKEQKLSAAEGAVHGELKKLGVDYSENRLCKTLSHHRAEKRNPRIPGFIFLMHQDFWPQRREMQPSWDRNCR